MLTSKIGVWLEAIGQRLQERGGDEPPVFWTIERMTHRGGWERVARYDDGPPEPKSPYRITPPSKIRCVRRRGWRIDEDGVEWVREHPKAAERYRRFRLLEELEEAVDERLDEIEAERQDADLADRFVDALLAGDLDGLDEETIESAEAIAEVQEKLEPTLLEQWSEAKSG